MNKKEFEELYPADNWEEKPWVISRKITHVDDNDVIIQEIIDLNHPECPIVKWINHE